MLSHCVINITIDGARNDVWRFDLATNWYTWIAGGSALNDPGSYGSVGQPTPQHYPSSRYGHAAVYISSTNSMVIFGGAIGSSKLLITI
jgi:hypothetical protein